MQSASDGQKLQKLEQTDLSYLCRNSRKLQGIMIVRHDELMKLGSRQQCKPIPPYIAQCLHFVVKWLGTKRLKTIRIGSAKAKLVKNKQAHMTGIIGASRFGLKPVYLDCCNYNL